VALACISGVIVSGGDFLSSSTDFVEAPFFLLPVVVVDVAVAVADDNLGTVYTALMK
jgi:hypothetical protein